MTLRSTKSSQNLIQNAAIGQFNHKLIKSYQAISWLLSTDLSQDCHPFSINYLQSEPPYVPFPHIFCVPSGVPFYNRRAGLPYHSLDPRSTEIHSLILLQWEHNQKPTKEQLWFNTITDPNFTLGRPISGLLHWLTDKSRYIRRASWDVNLCSWLPSRTFFHHHEHEISRPFLFKMEMALFLFFYSTLLPEFNLQVLLSNQHLITSLFQDDLPHCHSISPFFVFYLGYDNKLTC